MTGLINHVVVVLVILCTCTLITISTAQKADDDPTNPKNQTTKVANLTDFQKDVSVLTRHSTIVPPFVPQVPTPKFPLLTKFTTWFFRRNVRPIRIRVISKAGELAPNSTKLELPRKRTSQEIGDARKKYNRRKLRKYHHHAWLRNQEMEDAEEENRRQQIYINMLGPAPIGFW